MYADTPRSYIGNVWERHVYGDQPLGWDIIGTEETVRGRDARDVPRLPRPLVPAGAHGDRPRRPHRRRRSSSRARGARSATCRPQTTGAPEPVVLSENGSRVRHPYEAVGPGAPRHRRARLPARPPRPLRGAAPLDRPRRRHVVAALHRGARAARARVLRLLRRRTRYADAGTLAAQAGVDLNRIDEAVETIVEELRRVVSESVPADELEKARAFAKGRFVLGLESPHATIMFGLRREVLEGRAVEPDEVLAGLDAVTSRTSSASPPTSSAATCASP